MERETLGRLCVITDTDLQSRWSHFELARMALEGGADMIQYRRKQGATRVMIEEVEAIRAVARPRGIAVLVNDRVDLALAADADGLHLGTEDLPLAIARDLLGPSRIIGGSCDQAEEAIARSREGFDYAGIGPIFATRTKSDTGPVLGLEGLKRAVEVSPIPLLAIGGITLENVGAVLETGVHGVAVISAICLAEDPSAATAAFRAALKQHQLAG